MVSEASEGHAFDLHLEEYKSLRAEILARQDVRSRTLQLGVGAIVAIWAFLATRQTGAALAPLVMAAWWLPLVIALAALWQNYVESQGVKQAGAYLALIEERYGDPLVGGWENTLIRLRWDAEKKRAARRGVTLPTLPDRPGATPFLAVLRAREFPQGPARVSRWLWTGIAAACVAVALVANWLLLNAAHMTGE